MSISPPNSPQPTGGRTLSRIELWFSVLCLSVVAIISVVMFFAFQYQLRTLDSAEDVREMAAEVEAAVINDPEAISFEYVPTGKDSRAGVLVVGDSPAVTFDRSTSLVNISISAVDESGAKVENGDPAAVPGEYVIEAYCTKGWGGGGGTPADPVTYESRVGEVVLP